MKTLYDLVSLIAFAGLAILYLQRASSPIPNPVAPWRYATAAFGCALADYLGDQDMALASIVTFVALAVFTVTMLRPFQVNGRGL